MPELKGHSSKDQRCEHEKEGEVETAEDRGVPEWERSEGGSARSEEPDLIAVPNRPDGIDHDATVHIVLRDEGEQSPNPEVEAFEEEVPQPENPDQGEPELFETAR